MSNANQAIQPHLEAGQIIPTFTLPGPDGMPHSPWDYKQRQHLVLLFVPSTTTTEARGLLRAFALHYTAFREESCAILAISPDPVITNLQTQEELHLPFPLLADPQAGVISRYTQWDNTTGTLSPSILLADRYGALYSQWRAESESDLPPIEDLLESLRYLNSLCVP